MKEVADLNKPSNLPIALGLFVLSLILRICLISKGAYHLDTLNLIIKTDDFFQTGVFQSQFGPGYPMMMALCILFTGIGRLLGSMDTVLAVNMVSVISSALCVPALYVLARKMYSNTAALLASIMFSVSPMFLGVSVYGKSHAPAVLFLILGLIYFLKYRESGQIKNLVISSIYIGCMGASRVQDMLLMIVPITVYYFWISDLQLSWANKLKRFVLSIGIVSAIVVLMHVPYLLSGKQGEYQSNFGNFVITGLTQNFKGIFSGSLARTMQFFQLNMTGVGVLSVLFGFFYMLSDQKKWAHTFFIALWIFVPLLFYGNLHTTAPRFFVMILPAIYISLGYFFARLISINRLFAVMSTGVYILIFSLTLWKISGVLVVRHQHDFITDNAKWMEHVTEPDARIIMCDERYFVDVYGHRASFSRPLRFDQFSQQDLNAFKIKLDAAIVAGDPIYITTTGLYFYDPDQQFSDFIKANYRLELRGWHMYEDWHRGEMFSDVFPNYLFRISRRS